MGVGSELESEGQGLTQMLLCVFLGGKEDRTIGAWDLNLGHTVHQLYILKTAYSMECFWSTLL